MLITNKFRFGVSLISPLLAGFIGALFVFPAISVWYKELIKPSFNPPDWVFGPTWSFLYILIGVAFYIVWQSDASEEKKKIAFGIFASQLVLNALWPILFFGFKNPEIALIEIFILWLGVLTNLVLFGQIKTPAGWLLAPYLVWVSFAAVLNFSIWQLNL